MSRKRKPLPILENITVTDVAAEGNAIARVSMPGSDMAGDGMVVFVPFAAPGDVADIRLTKRKRNFAEGTIERLISPSDLRVEPRCPHFGTCGGCRWQHLPYSFQLECKQRQVTDALQRIGHLALPAISPIIGSDNIWEYRNKMEYTFSNRKWLTWQEMRELDADSMPRDGAGFHIPGAFDKVLDIDCCHLAAPLSNEIRDFVREYGRRNALSFYDLRAQQGLLRTLMVRTASTGETMAVLSMGCPDRQNPSETLTEQGRELLDAIADRFGDRITSLMYVVNTKVNDAMGDLDIKLWSGRDYIEEEMEGLRFRVGPKSFYQTNSAQAYRLYSVARDMAALTGSELVYDLYTGTGTIANFVARKARKVIGIEYVAEAIADARVNSAVNGIDNTLFVAGDMKDVLTDEFIAGHGHPDVMIVDPPRAGMHDDVVRVILNAAPRRIVYVSCNPATQARDVAALAVAYDIKAVQPVDMFPHTQHVENVLLLELHQ